MKRLIEETRRIYDTKKVRFGFFDRRYNRVSPPSWMKKRKDTRLEAQYRDQELLLSQGDIVFAHLVQANSMLFETGKFDNPAAIVFSLDRHYDDNLGELQKIGHVLFGLKGHSVEDPELKEFADVITDEMKTLFNVPLPSGITDGHEVFCSSIMIHRKHIPSGFMQSGWIPLLVNPRLTNACRVLPERYWAQELVEYWTVDL